MEIKVTIQRCPDCRHLQHSGAFTPGGAKPVCTHPQAVVCFAKDKILDEPYHWKHRVVRIEKAIPEQCPLKHGHVY